MNVEEQLQRVLRQQAAVSPSPDALRRILAATVSAMAEAPSKRDDRSGIARPRRGRQLVAAATALAVAVGIFAVLTRSFSGKPGPHSSPAPVNACHWKVVPTPNSSPSVLDNRLTAVSASGPNDAWAVGSAVHNVEGGQSYPLLMHWDGTRWTLVPSALAARNAYLMGVASITPDDAWAVGFAGPLSPHPLVEHWNGTSWSDVPIPAPSGTSTLSAVFAISTDDVWAVGSEGRAKGLTLIEHWNGSRWAMVTSPNASPAGFRSAPDNNLAAVGASAPGDVVAAGTTRDGGHVYHADPLIERWNGSSWTLAPAPVFSPVTRLFLESVSVVSAADVWVVGAASSATGAGESPFIGHWDGSRWTPVGLAVPGQGVLFGVTTASGNIWAVGNETGPLRPLIEHGVNDTWTALVPLTPPRSALTGVAASPDGTIWAVGSASGAKESTLALRCAP